MKTPKQEVLKPTIIKQPKKNPAQPSSSTKDGETPIRGQDTAVGKEYSYILTTIEQRKAIKITQHKSKLEKIIKSFFTDRLLNIKFTDDGYTLTLKDEFLIGEKRRLGRLISEGSDLHKFVKKVIYNGTQDTSGQLFRIQKSSELTDEKV